jgi:hypothetical protein
MAIDGGLRHLYRIIARRGQRAITRGEMELRRTNLPGRQVVYAAVVAVVVVLVVQ